MINSPDINESDAHRCAPLQVFADPTSPHGGPLHHLIGAQDHASLFSNVDDLVSSSSVR